MRWARTPRWRRPLRRAWARGWGVGDHLPVVRGGHREREARLEVGLLEDREHPAAVGDLELRVQVDLAVHRVGEAVQPLPGVHVCRGRVDRERVVFRRGGDGHAQAVEVGRRVERLTVEGDRLHGGGDQVDEGRCSRLGARERDRGGAPEGRVRGGEVEGDVVVVDVDDGGAGGGLVAGEVLARQRCSCNGGCDICRGLGGHPRTGDRHRVYRCCGCRGPVAGLGG